MTDASEPIRSGTTGQVSKRRRFNDSPANDKVPAPTEGYDQWNADPQLQQGSKTYTSAADPQSFTTRPEYSNPAVVSTDSNPTGGSQWSQAVSAYPELSEYQQRTSLHNLNSLRDESAYPDLTGHQQQPYFYPQSTNPAAYTSSWPPSEAQPSEGTGGSGNYSVGEQTAATTMPYFPPQTASQVAPTTEAVDESTAISYSDLEHATQYAYSKPSALVTAAQREAAKQSSAFYFDDASMHLKIQSLPILDNLVC
jgi:hypothetical protein